MITCEKDGITLYLHNDYSMTRKEWEEKYRTNIGTLNDYPIREFENLFERVKRGLCNSHHFMMMSGENHTVLYEMPDDYKEKRN